MNYSYYKKIIYKVEKRYTRMCILYSIFKNNYYKNEMNYYKKLLILYYRLLIKNKDILNNILLNFD